MEQEKSRIGVFTSPTCSHCPGALKLAKEISKERNDVRVEEYSLATSVGKKMAVLHQVHSFPTIFVQGPAHHETIAFRGSPSRDKLRTAIDVTQGRKTVDILEDKREGLFKKLKSFFD